MSAVTISGVASLTLAQGVTNKAMKSVGLVGIRGDDGEGPAMWLMGDDYLTALDAEKRNLIKAKVRSIIGTAVFGAGLAIAVGALIGVIHKQKQ